MSNAPSAIDAYNIGQTSCTIEYYVDNTAAIAEVQVLNLSNTIVWGSSNIPMNFGAGWRTVGVTGLTAGTTYYARARTASDSSGGGISPWKNSANFITQSAPIIPGPPTINSANATSSTSGIVYFTKGTNAATTNIYLYRSSDGALINTYSTSGTSQSMGGLTPGTQYYVKAYSTSTTSNTSSWTNPAYFTTTTSAPLPPTINSVSDLTSTSATVYFTKGTNANVTNIYLYRSSDSALINTYQTSGTSQPMAGLAANTQYYVKAYSTASDSSTSAWTNPAYFTTTVVAIVSIYLNSPIDVSLSAGAYAEYQFTPGSSGAYQITTSPYGGGATSNDTVLELYYDAAMTTAIAVNDDYGGTTFSQINANLTGGTTYYIKLGPFNNGSVYARLTVSTPAPGVPGIPGGLSGSGPGMGGGVARAYFDWPANATSVGVKYSPSGADPGGGDMVTSTNTNQAYLDIHPNSASYPSGTLLYWWIRAIGPNGASPYSSTQAAYVGIANAPTNSNALAQQGYAHCTWIDDPDCVTTDIYVSTSSTDVPGSSTSPTAQISLGTGYYDYTGTPGTTYYIWIRTTAVYGSSGWLTIINHATSNPTGVTILATTPDPPVINSVSQITQYQATAYFTPGARAAVTNIYLYLSSDNSLINTYQTSDSQQTMGGLLPGTQYYIKAYSTASDSTTSSWTQPAYFTTAARVVPGPPTITQIANIGQTSANVYFTVGTDAASTNIYVYRVSDGLFINSYSVAAPGTVQTIGGLTAYTDYYVRAYSTSTTSDTSSWTPDAYFTSRPSDFTGFAAISSGGGVYNTVNNGDGTATAYIMPYSEWNLFIAKINEFRDFKSQFNGFTGLGIYAFTQASTNLNFSADIVNQAVNAINGLGYSLAQAASGQDISYSFLVGGLKGTLNSVS